MKWPKRSWKWLARTAGVLMLVLSSAASAQLGGLGLPGGLPGGGIVQGLPGSVNRTTDQLGRTIDTTVDTVKHDVVGRPILSRAIDRDPLGARIVRGELLAVSPSDAGLAAARALHFDIVRRDTLGGLGLEAVVLEVPDGMSASEALAALKKADPQGSYDYDHLYDPSGDGMGGGGAETATPDARAIRIGMIDGGVAVHHPAFAAVKIVTKNIAASRESPPTEHGTAVASLLVGEDGDFHGYLPHATLYAADAFGGNPAGGAADDIVRALDWLATNRVAVVNVSLAGPPNALLEAGVKAFLARGHILVAAVGNAGPAAPIAYPAGYRGVVAVTSVDARHRLQIDANRGSVMFAARGVDVRAAATRGYAAVTGTSFAAPVVAARLAWLIPEPDVRGAGQAVLTLEHAARPLGNADSATGYGYLDPPQSAQGLK